MKIQLVREWDIGEPIGKGGFGQVFAAKSSNMPSAVAKFVPKSPGNKRELLFVNLEKVRNVIPVIDSGETENSWVLVMPRAAHSLRQYIKTPASLSLAQAVQILIDVATALADIDGKVVHRDLKPENILFYENAWCLADFGISRYAEATTAPDTKKYALSPPYAAPERWRSERAVSAADVYSFGCIAYELVSGSLPFNGPTLEDFREQHLHSQTPELSGIAPALQALISECLYKAPETRPTPGNILARLQRIPAGAPTGGLGRLQQANLVQIARQSEAEREASEWRSRAERRDMMATDAREGLKRIADRMLAEISSVATAARVNRDGRARWSISLNQARLEFSSASITPAAPWDGWTPPAVDVVAHAHIGITIPTTREGYEGRSHSLWFCDAREAGRYQWFETAFMGSPLIPNRGTQNPFFLDPGAQSAKALWNGMSTFQLAWPFSPLGDAEAQEFIHRWANWLADAANGQLRRPSCMPEKPTEGSWRRH
jgi:eukaryotic-like serine/threonine-protein kinase